MTAYTDSRGIQMNMTFSEALDIIHDLATENQIDERDITYGDDGLSSQREWQQAALDTLEDLIVNHHEEIDDRFERPTGPQKWRTSDFRITRSMDPEVPSYAIRICLEMAEGVAIDPDDEINDDGLTDQVDRQQCAFDLVRDFIGLHGNRLDDELIPINVQAFFDPEPRHSKMPEPGL